MEKNEILEENLEKLSKEFKKYKKSQDLKLAFFNLNHMFTLYFLVFFLIGEKFKNELIQLNISLNLFLCIGLLFLCVFFYKDIIITSKWIFNKIIGIKS